MLDPAATTCGGDQARPQTLPCPACGGTEPYEFYRVQQIPVQSTLRFESAAAALACRRADLRLRFCQDCALIWNVAFDPSLVEYAATANTSQAASETFSRFARELAGRWIERYRMQGSRVVEVGCGSGAFLCTVCELAGATGIGIDPSAEPHPLPEPLRSRVTFQRERLSDAHASLQPNFIICRHTLEHVADPVEFLGQVHRVARGDPEVVVLFEVPDTTRIVSDGAFWDIYYEHCNYFTPESLEGLFRRCGFQVLELSREFNEQYLVIAAKPVSGAMRPVPARDIGRTAIEKIMEFKRRVSTSRRQWRGMVRKRVSRGERVALWGALSKGTAFLSTLDLDATQVEYVVDINPRLWGTYIPATGQPVVAPAEIVHRPPDVVIVMNPVYLEEISQEVRSLGVSADLVPVAA